MLCMKLGKIATENLSKESLNNTFFNNFNSNIINNLTDKLELDRTMSKFKISIGTCSKC